MKKITIYDLAELSGVSASAVSAILNGNWKNGVSAPNLRKR
jgi:LacI family fructose operon transcriptional repressor